jgi:hypothetical protein
MGMQDICECAMENDKWGNSILEIAILALLGKEEWALGSMRIT